MNGVTLPMVFAMPHRYKQIAPPPKLRFKLFAGLREKFNEGYTISDFKADLFSGMVVGVVALPLGMAFAIATGVAPQHGLYTVIIAGALVGLLGGSRFQISGPTASFVVLEPIVRQFGLAGLLTAGLMAGIILISMGIARMGRLIQFIPYPVTTGFSTGIALVMVVTQIKDFFGLQMEKAGSTFFERVQILIQAAPTCSYWNLGIASLTLALLVLWPKITKKIPAPLVVLAAMAVLTAGVKIWIPSAQIATIHDRFHTVIDGDTVSGIPAVLPSFSLPWSWPGANNESFQLNLAMIQAIIPSAFAVAMLGAIESLLSAVVADGMTQSRHDPDAELMGQGFGNLVCPFFGGIAATGAIARTATNIRFGARSPISAVVHSAFVLAAVLLMAPLVSMLPMASLAALLVLVSYNISRYQHFIHIVRMAPKSDVMVLLLCFSLTVVFDMVVGVTVGVILAALLFMRRMAEMTQGLAWSQEYENKVLPGFSDEVLVYEVAGPLFFGAAERAIHSLHNLQDKAKIALLVLEKVPSMDVTGMVALESSVHKLHAKGIQIMLVGAQKQPLELLKKSSVLSADHVLLVPTMDEAAKIIRDTNPAQNSQTKSGDGKETISPA